MWVGANLVNAALRSAELVWSFFAVQNLHPTRTLALAKAPLISLILMGNMDGQWHRQELMDLIPWLGWIQGWWRQRGILDSLLLMDQAPWRAVCMLSASDLQQLNFRVTTFDRRRPRGALVPMVPGPWSPALTLILSGMLTSLRPAPWGLFNPQLGTPQIVSFQGIDVLVLVVLFTRHNHWFAGFIVLDQTVVVVAPGCEATSCIRRYNCRQLCGGYFGSDNGPSCTRRNPFHFDLNRENAPFSEQDKNKPLRA